VRGFTSSLWPIRYKPLPDELLSCWLVRLAHGHGLKVQTFCNLTFGSRRQVWNRDIDRLAPAWLIDELCCRTGTSHDVALNTTLRAYEGLLYRHFQSAGALPWILTLKTYHRKRRGFGLQFCPTCLAEDSVPYFRKRWRVACLTRCQKHGILLLDRCPSCATAVAVHRIDMANSSRIENIGLSYCHACGFDLRNGPTTAPSNYDQYATVRLRNIGTMLGKENSSDNEEEIGHLEVLRHLCTLMTTNYKYIHLRKYVSERLGIADLSLTPGRVWFEARPIDERHHLIQLALWIPFQSQARRSLAQWHRQQQVAVDLRALARLRCRRSGHV
jgi:hypothetical protein